MKKIIISLILSTQLAFTYGQLQYFGYYHIEGVPFYTNQYIDQYSNMDYINCGVFCTAPIGDSTTDIYTKCRTLFAKARSKNIKLWVQVYDAFFFWPGGNKNGDGSGYLFSDWQTRWDNVKSSVDGYEDVVLGFYFDEPFWCGVKESDFRAVTSLIRTELPTMKILAVESGFPVKPSVFGVSIPEVSSTYFDFCTDLGFDTYERDWDSGDYNTLFNAIKTKAAQNQSIWLVPSGTLQFQDSYTVADNLLKWYQLANWESRVKGLLVYTLTSAYGPTGSDFLINNDPFYKTMHLAVGREISWNDPVHKNLWNAQLDFSGTQGANQWLYQYWDGSQLLI